MKEINEITEGAAVIRSKGDAPKQYGDEDDDDYIFDNEDGEDDEEDDL